MSRFNKKQDKSNSEVEHTMGDHIKSSYLHDKAHSEGTGSKPLVHANIRWVIRAVVVVCIILAVYAAVKVNFFSKNNSEDPNWSKIHIPFYSVADAIAFFGDDLLLDRLILNNIDSVPYVEFILTHVEGGAEDRQSWETISASVYYGGERFSTDEDYTTLYIFFDEDDPNLGTFSDRNSFRFVFADSSTTTEINGITVEYTAFPRSDFHYAFAAEFNYGGRVYFLYTFSKENANIFWDTLDQLLAGIMQ